MKNARHGGRRESKTSYGNPKPPPENLNQMDNHDANRPVSEATPRGRDERRDERQRAAGAAPEPMGGREGRHRMRDRVSQFKRSGRESWDELRSGLEDAWEDLKMAFDRARACWTAREPAKPAP